MKVVFLICDGLGDRPIKEFGWKTPLEAARKPNFDELAKNGICGLIDPIDVGVRPGSDVAHLSLFGYDPKKYYHGRGPYEVAGIGMGMKPGDVALRGNLATVGKDLVILDRRAGRIESTKEFVKDLNGMKINGVKFFVKPGTWYRVGIIMRGRNLSGNISDGDPHIVGEKPNKVKPLDKTKESKFTADVLNKFLDRAHEILEKNPRNEERASEGKPPANFLLVRGAGTVSKIPSFQERYDLKACCIAGTALYRGIGLSLGMELIEVEGATGKPDTNVKAKFESAKNALKKYDFVFTHVKGADPLGEDGDYRGKRKFIEKIDNALSLLKDLENVLLVVTSDHSTPCKLKIHSGDPVPLVLCTKEPGVIRTDDVKTFGERACSKGGLGRIRSMSLMNEVMNLIGKAKLYGA